MPQSALRAHLTFLVIFFSFFLLISPAGAADSEAETLRAKVASLTRMVDVLNKRVEALEGDKNQSNTEADTSANTAAVAKPAPAGFVAASPAPAIVWNPPAVTPNPAAGAAGTGRLRLIDLSVSLLNDYSLSTAGGPKFRKLQGGDHDPKNKGFSAPNEEFVMGGVVDENFRGDLVLVTKLTETGETELEIEEAKLLTLGLGHGLQVNAGSWFQDFGRLNDSHPHSWDFVNQPVVYTRLMSKDNMKSPGAQLSWLVPSKEYYKLYLAAQSPIGGSMTSFRSNGGNDLSGTDAEHQMGGHSFLPGLEVQGIRDLVYTTRLETSRMLSDEATVVGGMSFSTGPNATGRYARTNIYGLDLYYKWKPLNNDHGWPFWTWQTEVLKRNYKAASSPLFTTPSVILPDEHLKDWGFYSQLVYGFKRQWTAGLRLDYAKGDSAPAAAFDPLRDRRWRISPNITHFLSEFSKLRFQYDYDVAKFLGDKPEHTFTVQYEVNFGAHGAHKF